MVATKGTATRSRRKTVVAKNITLDGKTITSVYCRRCMTDLKPDDFYDATDGQIDRNGKMSVCKSCIDDLFSKIFAVEHDISKTILRLCRMLNVVYIDAAVSATIQHVEKLYDKNGNLGPTFGYYKSKVVTMSQINSSGILTFSEPVNMHSDTPLQDNEVENPEYFKQFWGDGLSFEDYAFLENELNDWRKTHKSDTKAELTLLKEICFKMLEIRKKRDIATGGGTGGLVKELQELMKTASVDPAKASMANAGKSQDTFSSFIKTIEENEPAEIYADKSLFKDYDNIEWYFDKFVRRSLKNFITGSRDFNLDSENESEDSEIDIEGYANLDQEGK